ncbi:hypothetical protein ElyMa_004327000 [Elysia marginata]|uniref:Uncharacterized protein n=1 Tax=Elysia marginata TaxID=1093978 RepID=A0AAV4H125_9GAST|nr:hypothetical protein ElyMa_004327000 [Elysia marginata]
MTYFGWIGRARQPCSESELATMDWRHICTKHTITKLPRLTSAHVEKLLKPQNLSYTIARTIENLDRQSGAAPQTCRPGKAGKDQIASSTRRGSIFEVETEIKKKKKF